MTLYKKEYFQKNETVEPSRNTSKINLSKNKTSINEDIFQNRKPLRSGNRVPGQSLPFLYYE